MSILKIRARHNNFYSQFGKLPLSPTIRKFVGFSYGTWTNVILSFVSTPLIAWFVSPDQLGKAALFIVAYNILTEVALLGTDQGFIRFFNESGEKNRPVLLISSVFVPLLFYFVLALALIINAKVVSMFLFNEPDNYIAVRLLAVGLIIGILHKYNLTLIRMSNMAVKFSNIQIISAIANVLVTLFSAIILKYGFYAIVLGSLSSQLISITVVFLEERLFWLKVFHSLKKLSIKVVVSILSYGLPFLPTIAFDWVLQNINTFYLKEYRGFADLGIYIAALKLASVLNIVQTGFIMFWVPHFYDQYNNNPENKGFYVKTFQVLLFILICLITFSAMFNQVLGLVLPQEYFAAVYLFPALMFSPMFVMLSYITYVGIDLMKKTYYHIIISFLSCLCSIGFGYILIPSFGVWGAVFSSLGTYSVLFLSRTFISSKLYPVRYAWIKILTAMIVSLGIVIFSAFNQSLVYKPVLLVNIIVCFFLFKNELLNIVKYKSFEKVPH